MLSISSSCNGWVGSWWFTYQVAAISLPLGQAGLGTLCRLDIFGWFWVIPSVHSQCQKRTHHSAFFFDSRESFEDGWLATWLVVLHNSCSFFGPLDILRALKQQSTWRSTVDVKMWSVQWWMQMDAIIPQMLGLDQRTCCRVGLLLEVVDSF